VNADHFGAKRWGIGLGFACGILLAALALSEVPFLGHSRTEPHPRSLPRPQNRDAQANLDPFDEVVASNRPITEPAPVAKSAKLSLSNAPIVGPQPVRVTQEPPPAPSVLSPLVPPPRDLDEDPREQMKFAQFLIKARLAPIAAGPLRKVVKEAPDTSIAREAQHTLDVISRN
jgi:hypothetical protein